jgi:hypothetical protein
MDAATLSTKVRRAGYVLAAAGVVYLWSRYDVYDVPQIACSPVVGVAPGARLLLDRWAKDAREHDVLLFRDAAGALHLGRVEAAPGALSSGELWIGGDDPACPGFESSESGAVPRERIEARVLIAF